MAKAEHLQKPEIEVTPRGTFRVSADDIIGSEAGQKSLARLLDSRMYKSFKQKKLAEFKETESAAAEGASDKS